MNFHQAWSLKILKQCQAGIRPRSSNLHKQKKRISNERDYMVTISPFWFPRMKNGKIRNYKMSANLVTLQQHTKPKQKKLLHYKNVRPITNKTHKIYRYNEHMTWWWGFVCRFDCNIRCNRLTLDPLGFAVHTNKRIKQKWERNEYKTVEIEMDKMRGARRKLSASAARIKNAKIEREL